MSVKIQIPKSPTTEPALKFCSYLQNLPDSEEYIFDFKEIGFIRPFIMLLLASNFRLHLRKHPKSVNQAINFQSHTYLAHMGFFQDFGLDFGNEPGEASGNDRYLPITVIKIAELEKEAAGNFELVQETIERQSKKLAEILIQNKNKEILDTLTFSIREILRNSVEHSKSETIEICAQFWPTQKTVEIAILDTGIGIAKTLKENPRIKFESDREAINLSLMPGISRISSSKSQKNSNHWANSGFGLYMTSTLCGRGGDYLIFSGSAGLKLKDGKRTEYQSNFPGTALRMKLKTDNIKSYTALLAEISKKGTIIAKELGGIAELRASSASMMLSRDFKKNP